MVRPIAVRATKIYVTETSNPYQAPTKADGGLWPRLRAATMTIASQFRPKARHVHCFWGQIERNICGHVSMHLQLTTRVWWTLQPFLVDNLRKIRVILDFPCASMALLLKQVG